MRTSRVNTEILFANTSYNLLSESDLKSNQQFDDIEQDGINKFIIEVLIIYHKFYRFIDEDESVGGGSLTVGGGNSGRNTPVTMRRDASGNDLAAKVPPPRPVAPPKRPPAPKIG